MKQKFFFLFLLAFCSFYANAQFKDSSLILIHDVSVGYNRFNTFENQFQGGTGAIQEGSFPVFNFSYAPTIGRMKKNHVTFYGVKFQYSTNKFDGFVKDDTTAWNSGVVFGKKYFILVAKNLYILPSSFLSATYGKEKLEVKVGWCLIQLIMI